METNQSACTPVVDVGSLEALAGLAQDAAGASEFAVDVEADSMHHFDSRLCFVQVQVAGRIYLVDMLAADLGAAALAGALGAAFADHQKRKVLHAAAGDLQFLRECGMRLRGLFDTHRAATLLGRPKVGLADLVLEVCGVALNKVHQQADFSRRPLPAELRDYIAADVRYLAAVAHRLWAECSEADILEEVRLDCDRLSAEAEVRPDLAQDYSFRLPRADTTALQRAAARQLASRLHALRLEWARAADVPMGRMLSNAAIVAVATSAPRTARELGRCEGVRASFVRQHGDEVLRLVQEVASARDNGHIQPDEDAPRDPSRARRENALLAWRKEAAARRRVTPSVVLSNALVGDLARSPPESVEALAALPFLGAKRVELYGRELLSLLRPLQ